VLSALETGLFPYNPAFHTGLLQADKPSRLKVHLVGLIPQPPFLNGLCGKIPLRSFESFVVKKMLKLFLSMNLKKA
jgi:hypothetical protein